MPHVPFLVTGIEGIVFDMDGLLIDTEPIWRRSMIEVFGEVGLELTEEQCMETMGVRVAEVVDLWYDRQPWQGPSKEEITRRIIDGVIDHVAIEGEPMPGVLQAFELVHQLGLPVAIASSSSENLIEAVLETLGVRHLVLAIRSADDEQEGKPHPAVYLSAARALGVSRQACVAFEDSPNGVLSAKAAGMLCIAVPDPLIASDQRFDVADLRLSSLTELTSESLATLVSDPDRER